MSLGLSDLKPNLKFPKSQSASDNIESIVIRQPSDIVFSRTVGSDNTDDEIKGNDGTKYKIQFKLNIKLNNVLNRSNFNNITNETKFENKLLTELNAESITQIQSVETRPGVRLIFCVDICDIIPDKYISNFNYDLLMDVIKDSFRIKDGISIRDKIAKDITRFNTRRQQLLLRQSETKVNSYMNLLPNETRNTHKPDITVKFLERVLKNENMFKDINDEFIRNIIKTIYRIDCFKSDCVLKENETSNAMFIVQHGIFEMSTKNIDIKPQTIRPGDTFNKRSLLGNNHKFKSKYTVKCKSDKAVLWVLERKTYINMRSYLSRRQANTKSNVLKDLRKLDFFGL